MHSAKHFSMSGENAFFSIGLNLSLIFSEDFPFLFAPVFFSLLFSLSLFLSILLYRSLVSSISAYPAERNMALSFVCCWFSCLWRKRTVLMANVTIFIVLRVPFSSCGVKLHLILALFCFWSIVRSSLRSTCTHSVMHAIQRENDKKSL